MDVDTQKSQDKDKDNSPAEDGRADERESADSTWGQGSASAFQKIRNMERRAAKSKPPEERPSNE